MKDGLERYKFIKDIIVYEKKRVDYNDSKWTTKPIKDYEYKWSYKKDELYDGADRTEYGSWLIANNLLMEVKN